jgi:hypothetical protein
MKKSHIHLKSPGIMAINVTSDICQINQQNMYYSGHGILATFLTFLKKMM